MWQTSSSSKLSQTSLPPPVQPLLRFLWFARATKHRITLTRNCLIPNMLLKMSRTQPPKHPQLKRSLLSRSYSLRKSTGLDTRTAGVFFSQNAISWSSSSQRLRMNIYLVSTASKLPKKRGQHSKESVSRPTWTSCVKTSKPAGGVNSLTS